MMWVYVFRGLRAYAPYITLPFAAIVGVIGYNLENLFSDKYTPYNKSIKESRSDRLITDESLTEAASVEKLKYNSKVLNTNIPPSLQN